MILPETALWAYTFAASALFPAAPHYDGSLPGPVALASPAPAAGGHALTTLLLPAYAVSGSRARAYGDDLYHRVHLSTRTIALGNVIGVQTRDVLVWNAHLYGRRLIDIARINADGIEVIGTVPADLAALGEYTYTVRATSDGPPVIDATLTWRLDQSEDLPVRVTGQRITAWVWLPDWSEPVLERLAWATDVLIAHDGTERRRSLRLGPRRAVEWSCLVHGSALRRLANTAHGWGARAWARPEVYHGSRLTAAASGGAMSLAFDTALMGLAEDDMLMLHDGGERAEIASVATVSAGGVTLQRPIGGAWPSGSRVYRAVSARLEGAPGIAYGTDAIARIEPQFADLAPADWPDVHGLTLYRGAPVLSLRHDWTDAPELAMPRKLDDFDPQTGKMYWDDESGQPQPRITRTYLLRDRAEVDAMRRLLAHLRGRHGVLWLDSATTDLTAVAPMPGVAVSIDVAWCGYALYVAAAPMRRDLRIETAHGVYLRRVLAAEEVSGTVERLTLDAALGVEHAVEDFRRVSFLIPCRLASDAVELAWVTDTIARCRVTWQGVQDAL